MSDIQWTHLNKTLNDFADYFIASSREKIQSHIATGNLFNNMKPVITITDDYMSVEIDLEDYWKYLDKGTRPHWPPYNAILNWVKVKDIKPSVNGLGKAPTVESLAYMIQRSIARKGTPAVGWFNPSKEEATKHFETMIELAVMEDIDQWVESMVKRETDEFLN